MNSSQYKQQEKFLYHTTTAAVEKYYDNVKDRTVIKKTFYEQNQYEKEVHFNKLAQTANIIRMIEYDDESKSILFEDGGDNLFGLIYSNSITEAEAVRNFKNIFLSVKELHDLNIFHGDIKLENIVHKKGDYNYYLIDLGLSEIIQPGKKSDNRYGTAWYIAPESIKTHEHDLKADIYALGVTLYACLSCSMPFDTSSPIQYIYEQLNSEPDMSSLYKNDVSERMIYLIKKMLESDPTKRFDINECINYLYENN